MIYSCGKFISGNTSGSFNCEIYVRLWPICMLQQHIFEFLPRRDTPDYVSIGHLPEVKNNRKFQIIIPISGRRHLQEVVTNERFYL